jgi:hypothetical protein
MTKLVAIDPVGDIGLKVSAAHSVNRGRPMLALGGRNGLEPECCK